MLRRLASVRAQRWSSEIHRYLLCYCVCRCWRRSIEDVIVNALCATDASVHPAAADDADITAFDRSDDHTADDKGWIMSMRHMSSIKHRTNTASRIFFYPRRRIGLCDAYCLVCLPVCQLNKSKSCDQISTKSSELMAFGTGSSIPPTGGDTKGDLFFN